MININTLNQNNNYSLGKPNITTPFSTLQMGETTTTTGNMGKVIPIFYKELQPSQMINARQAINIQFTPFVTNLMHQIKGELISYFVPYRLLWEEWEDFVTGGREGTKMPAIPSVTIGEIINKATRNTATREAMKEETEKAIEVLEKRITDYQTLGKTYEKQLAELAKETGTQLLKILKRETTSSAAFTDSNSEAMQHGIEGLENGYPYYNDENTVTGDLMTHELLVFEKAIQVVFLGTQWDYIGLPYSLAHLIYHVIREINPSPVGYQAIIKKAKDALDKKVITLPFKAYRKIYNDWIRLADWETELSIENSDDIEAAISIEDANYDWDYFTRARRYQIRGAMPTIPIMGGQEFKLQDAPNFSSEFFELVKQTGYPEIEINGRRGNIVELTKGEKNADGTIKQGSVTEFIEFTDVMTAAALMNYFSANARIRPRYAEHLLARWNVRIQDARLQLSEFIGINEIQVTSQGVVQTSAGGEGQTQQGNITGQLWGNGSNMSINYKAQEHGIVVTLLVVKPANSYEQGYPPWLRKRTRFDLPTPEMVNLPDMPIRADELDAYAGEQEIIGYKAIYDEYRTSINKVTGLLRPSNSLGLASYTMARRIKKPTIEKIVKCKPDVSRIKQYLDQPDFILITAIATNTSIPLPYTSDVRLAI